MDSRSAAHVLSQIAAFLELAGENRYKARAYQTAARSLLALGTDDLRPLLRSGELAHVRGIGPATLNVIRDVIESGESRYLEQLKEQMPEGLLELMRVPGLSNEKIHKLHTELGISSLEELETAARDGRLKKVKGFGPKTAEKILAGITFSRDAVMLSLYARAVPEARGLLAMVRAHPGVAIAEIAGSIRRKREVVGDIDIVAACREDPVSVAASFARGPGVRAADVHGSTASMRFVDGSKLDLYCVPLDHFGAALWRATGSALHSAELQPHLAARRLSLDGDRLIDADGNALPTPSEEALFSALGLAWIPPELREGQGEVAAAGAGRLPVLVEQTDLQGVLHCHTVYSDGKSTVAEMAEAAKARGWSYVGISDHSQAAFYASGLARETMLEQHDEIDAYNAGTPAAHVLKGVEADILADGRLDYDDALLDRFDYVIGSIHSRFKMDGAAITERVLRAMDDPHMTILAHPTGRLLLSREPYALDVEAVLEKAADRGVAVEINCDPHRMDLDWSYIKRARDLGVTIEIGPDAHSSGSLAWTELGVFMARKGWLEAKHVLNAGSAEDVKQFARRRRS